MSTMIKNTAKFLAMVLVTIAVLFLLNRLPGWFEKGILRPYPSLEAVRARLEIADIFVPSYFPEGLSWPPTEILAQNKPFKAVIMKFSASGQSGTSLLITQFDASHELDPGREMRISSVRERLDYSLKGRSAALEVGQCGDGKPCSRISWTQGAMRLDIRMKSMPQELLRIAESMAAGPNSI